MSKVCLQTEKTRENVKSLFTNRKDKKKCKKIDYFLRK